MDAKNSDFPIKEQWRHLPRFFLSPVDFANSLDFELEKKTFQHAIQARRLRVGQFFIMFDGSGTEYLAQIESIERHVARARWHGQQTVTRGSEQSVVLAVALVASEKMDWIVQKATELGADAIQPLITQHSFQLASHRWVEKQRHWEEVRISACEQSGRNVLPAIHPIVRLADWSQTLENRAACWFLSPFAEEPLSRMRQSAAASQPMHVLVGPEGGLSREEEHELSSQGWSAVHLGPRILRAETAAMAVLSQVLLP